MNWMLGNKRFLRSIKIRNLLSFGPDAGDLELTSLNVLIGPNGTGKSNLIEAISVLQAAPRNLLQPIQSGGGSADWLWKGSPSPLGEISVTVSYPPPAPLIHRLQFRAAGQRLELADETIQYDRASFVPGEPHFFYQFGQGSPVLTVYGQQNGEVWTERSLATEEIAFGHSILSQRKDPYQYPQLTFLGNEYEKIKLFREWRIGRSSEPRRPQSTGLPSDYLSEDAANLALVLNELEHRGLRRNLVERLQDADPAVDEISTRVQGGTILLFVHYSGLQSPISAARLSDGTIRYLCLLSILCHPDPPPLVCIEEPEIGLHPDLLPGLANLLVEASHRMQLIVTTHSDTLVDGLTKVPESVVVCEKRNGSTVMERRSPEELKRWLADYGLGQLWRRGDLGGNRW